MIPGEGRPGIFQRRTRSDIEDEIQNHLMERAELLIAAGWEPAAAMREAERRFGDQSRIRSDLEAIAREGPERGGGSLLAAAAADAGYALRGLRAAPGYAAAVAATLALGIGAAASIFAVVDALLLRPLAYRDAERWMEVGRYISDSAERISTWRETAEDVFDAWVVYQRETLVRVDGAMAQPLATVAVTPGAERLLGIPLVMGRGLSPADAAPGSDVALITRSYWERLGSPRDILGQTLRLESGTVTVVGVVDDRIRFPEAGGDVQLWLPLRDDYTFADRVADDPQGVWARLAERLSEESAQERLEQLAAGLDQTRPSDDTWRLVISRLGEFRQNSDVRRALWTLSAMVGVLFLIALVNGVNLLLVRASARGREISVRIALGASRVRIMRQLLAEGCVMGALGGLAAIALAWGLVAVVREILPSEVTFFSPHALAVETRTLSFVLGVSLAIGLLLGLVPAGQLIGRKATVPGPLGRGVDDAPARKRLRSTLVVTQVAMSMALLAGAGLLAKSFLRLLAVDPGFDFERVVLADLMASPSRYADGAARAELARRMEEALEARPEIDAVTVTGGGGFTSGRGMEAEGAPPPESRPVLVPMDYVAADYFATTGTTLVEGRAFDAADAGTDNVIVDRDFASWLWGAADPVGRRFRLADDEPWLTVIGVVEDLRLMGRDQRQGPYQLLYPRPSVPSYGYIGFFMRTAGKPEVLLPLFQETLRSIDPEQSYWRLRTAADALAEEEEKPRFLVTLVGLLAAVAVALASIGLYGVLAYSVARRARELGIRMVLGADRGQVRGMVLREGLAIAAVGVALGTAGALLMARLIESLLYEVPPRDVVTFTVTAAGLLGVAALASILPARRATRVDPVEVLRAE